MINSLSSFGFAARTWLTFVFVNIGFTGSPFFCSESDRVAVALFNLQISDLWKDSGSCHSGQTFSVS